MAKTKATDTSATPVVSVISTDEIPAGRLTKYEAVFDQVRDLKPGQGMKIEQARSGLRPALKRRFPKHQITSVAGVLYIRPPE